MLSGKNAARLVRAFSLRGEKTMTGYCFDCGRIAELYAGRCSRCWQDRADTGEIDANPLAVAEHELYAEAIDKLDRVLEIKKKRNHGK